MPSSRDTMLVSSPTVADRIARQTGHNSQPIKVTKMVGTKDVAQFMKLAAAAKKSTRKMGMRVA